MEDIPYVPEGEVCAPLSPLSAPPDLDQSPLGRAVPIVLSSLSMGLGLGMPLELDMRGLALSIVPTPLHKRVRLDKAGSWVSTRGWCEGLG